MRPNLVVVSTPFLHLLAGVVKRQKPVLVQALSPELPVERLDVGVVCRLPWPGEVERDVIDISPQVEIPGNEFAAIARREEGLSIGYGRARSLHIAQRVAITGSQGLNSGFARPHR